MSSRAGRTAVIRGGIVASLLAVAITLPAQGPKPPIKSAVIDALRARLIADVAGDDVGGMTAAVVFGDSIVWVEGFGWADREKKVKPGVETIYRIGSITKSFTGVMLAQLVDRKLVTLDEPVDRLVPEIRAMANAPSTAPTLRQLSSHTAGVVRDPTPPARIATLATWHFATVAAMQSSSFVARPGDRYQYSNVGVAILGLALERAAKVAYPDYIAKNIFAPLGMTSSGFEVTPSLEPSLAPGYVVEPSGRIVRTASDGAGYSVPVGGIYSNVRDMARFVAALSGAGKRLMSDSMRQAMMTKQTPPAVGMAYGLGLEVPIVGGVKVAGHGGVVAGYFTAIAYDPESKIGVILMRNYDGTTPIAPTATQTVRDLVAERQGPKIALAAATAPSTRAGGVLRAWLDAFNSGEQARLDAYYRQYQPTEKASDEMELRRETGGFDLVSIEKSDADRVEFTVRARAGNTVAYGVLGVSVGRAGAGGPVVTLFSLNALAPGATASSIRVDAAQKRSAIEGAIAQLDEYYVFPDMAKRMGDSLRARLARGAYDAEISGFGFSARIAADLVDIGHDKHLRFSYSPRAIPRQPAAPSGPASPTRPRDPLSAAACGFVRREQLPGNVGYLKFNQFGTPEVCGAAATAAMTALGGSDALIIDLRENGGGSPEMVAYISSYLFGKRTHLNDLWTRKTGETREYWTTDAVQGARFGGEKPVYILTASRTFSAAEEFTYNLKALKRATIVGETTGGGAHPVSGHRADEHFMIGVPGARAINPITKTNWEGVGVEPDVKVPAADALAAAQKLIRERR